MSGNLGECLDFSRAERRSSVLNHTLMRLSGATTALAIAGCAVTPAAFAADGPAPATALGWQLDVRTTPSSVSPVGTAASADSAKNAVATATPKVGLTVSGRVNISTGLQRVEAEQYADSAYHSRSSVQFDAPATGMTGIPTLSTSTAFLRVDCVSDAAGTPTGSVRLAAPVPADIPAKPAPNTTRYFDGMHPFGTTEALPGWAMKVVWNEQTTLEDGGLQVVGMHTYYDAPGVPGSAAITGDVALGIVSCGRTVSAPEVKPTPIADPKIAGGAVVLALTGGYLALTARKERMR